MLSHYLETLKSRKPPARAPKQQPSVSGGGALPHLLDDDNFILHVCALLDFLLIPDKAETQNQRVKGKGEAAMSLLRGARMSRKSN